MGFLDNTGDNQLFDGKRQEMIQALARAILAEVGVDYVDYQDFVTYKHNDSFVVREISLNLKKVTDYK